MSSVIPLMDKGVTPPYAGTLLFLSVDLVNSTELKRKAKAQRWVNPLMDLFFEFPNHVRAARDGISEAIALSEWTLWRVSGDELVFYVPVVSEADIVHHLKILLSALESSQKKSEMVAKTSGDKSREMLLRSSCFLAPLGDDKVRTVLIPKNSADWPEENPLGFAASVLRGEEVAPGDYFVDFVGSAMDRGFRVAGYADRCKLTMSCEVALALTVASSRTTSLAFECATSMFSELRFFGERPLKGVADDYPIFFLLRNGKRSPHSSVLKTEPLLDGQLTAKYIKGLRKSHTSFYLPKAESPSDFKYVARNPSGKRSEIADDREKTGLPPQIG